MLNTPPCSTTGIFSSFQRTKSGNLVSWPPLHLPSQSFREPRGPDCQPLPQLCPTEQVPTYR